MNTDSMAILPIKKPNFKNIKLTPTKHHIHHAFRVTFWFVLGIFIGLFFFTNFLYFTYKSNYSDKIYEGVYVNGVDFGGENKEKVNEYFAKKNENIKKNKFILQHDEITASVSARQINFGYDEKLMEEQAFLIGRSGQILSDISHVLQSYLSGIHLPPATRYDEESLNSIILPLTEAIDKEPIEGVFNMNNGRVTGFKLSTDGIQVDKELLKTQILEKMNTAALSEKTQIYSINIPTVILEPKISTDKINNFGIKELIAQGSSKFAGSIENRAYNINLAANRINGALIAPGEVFSFNKTVGDISSFTGYKQAYVISGGKTILGDGGGVCQVSTTLFRAAINAGLPIVERNQHAYRVGYYEQDRAPGVDAAIYTPNVDLKFKNDTGKHILIQAFPDMVNYALSFQLFGTKDGREIIVNEPVILSTSAAPEAEYIDDPNLPKGEIKQIDFAAGGASVYFTRVVKKDGKEILNDKFVSNYRPWKAIYLRGTKE